MQDVLLQLLAPLMAAVVCGFAMGWMLWRRGRTFVSQAEYNRLIRSNASATQPLPQRARSTQPSAAEVQERAREMDALRLRSSELEFERQRLTAELESRTQRLHELSRVTVGTDKELAEQRTQLEAARRDLSHSETYIRALEAELRLIPASH